MARHPAPIALGRGALLLAALGAIVLGALLGGSAPPAEGQPRVAGPRVIARVGDGVVTSDDLARLLHRRYPDVWSRALGHLVDEHIVRREARRLGIAPPPAVVDQALAEEMAARREQLRETYGSDATLEEEVERAYGMDLERWSRDVLRPRLWLHHLTMRIIRLDTRRRPRVEARVIVTADEASARRVAAKIAAGADFSLVALQESIDPTAKAGGELPAIARGDLTLPGVEARLFEAGAGSLVGPLAVDVEGSPQWHLYKVIAHHPAWTGTREELLARLEEDLAEHPLARAEFERWRARMHRDFGVEIVAPVPTADGRGAGAR